MSDELLQFGGSLIGVSLLVALTWFLGFRQSGRIESEAEARDLLRLASGGFEPLEIGLDAQGRSAIARDGKGLLVALVPHGNQFVARPVDRTQLHPEKDGTLRIAVGQRQVILDLGDSVAGWTATDTGDN
ncbi:hypothetical protein OZN62_10310 [Aurantiacibacter sp. MUD11]|uniref:hypothetical protein n=1 Tax=Aurantiacibacter sp. MUD11 TaxID=3003265 RepID=UPI0022AA2610|nr:hypothetical protein [Aurantiacibacter sp. MUD11]WAT17318.1 hypothetical protein OZN62_10310 [Aurantiacibacter sp. MUD11]